MRKYVQITINEELNKEIKDGVKALFSVKPKINCDLIYHPVFVTDVTHCPDVALPFKINHSDKNHISADWSICTSSHTSFLVYPAVE